MRDLPKKVKMKKYSIAGFAFLLTLTAGFFLMNCAENTGGGGGPDGEGFAGFDPKNPNYSPSQFGFDSTRGGQATFTSGAPAQSDPRSLKKSGFALERERQWGVSAPIAEDSVDTDVFDDFRLGEAAFNSWDDISEFRVYVKLKKTGSKNNYYGGQVLINYWDYSREKKPERKITFVSGGGNDAKYNVWFKKSGKQYFHGFFQEQDGALILVIDKKTDVARSPDETTPKENLYSGSIWIMMFRTIFDSANSCNSNQMYARVHNSLVDRCAQDPLNQNCRMFGTGREKIRSLAELTRKCWFLQGGVYDCRTWRAGGGVDTFRAVEPDDNCYAKLGEFNGLDIVKAFGVKKVSELQVHDTK